MSAPRPRRCSTRWLDADCPSEVLAIIDLGPKEMDRFDVIFAAVDTITYPGSPRVEYWQQMICLNEHGTGYHHEMEAHKIAAFRYRMKNRYAKWSTLPDAVKAAVHAEIAELAELIAKEG